jgi:hypothetical protein
LTGTLKEAFLYLTASGLSFVVECFFNNSFSPQRKAFLQVASWQFICIYDGSRLDAVSDELATRKELRNLVAELERQGVKVRTTRVFVS